jgi:hypothetical protein
MFVSAGEHVHEGTQPPAPGRLRRLEKIVPIFVPTLDKNQYQ